MLSHIYHIARLLIVGCLSVGLFSMPCRALDGVTNDSSSLAGVGLGASTNESGTSTSADQLQVVVVTAEKRTESLQNIPVSISVLQGTQLDTTNTFGLAEELSRVPGVAITNAGFQMVTVRGVGPAAPNFDGQATIGYYLDSAPFALVKTAATPDLDPYDLERVEVLRGPQGVFYGAASLNGVVRILTRDADLSEFDAKGRVTGSYTDSGGGNGRADGAINIPIVDGVLGARLVAGYARWSGWIDRPNEDDANSAKLSNVRLKLDAQPTPELFIGLSYWYSRDDYADISQGYTYNRNSETIPEPIDNGFDTVALKVNYQFPLFSISSSTSYLDYKTINISDQGPETDDLADDPLYTGLHSNIYSEEMNLTSSGDDSWIWSGGGIYRHGKDTNDQSLPGVTPVPIVWFDESSSYAFFGQIAWRSPNREFEIAAGARYFHDHVQDLTAPGIWYSTPLDAEFSHVSPRVALTWHLNKDLTTYVSYSNGFRSGFGQSPLNALTVNNLPPVQPDQLDNYELGAKGDFLGGVITFDTSAYFMKWKDVQQSVNAYFDGVGISANVNGPSASGPGVDAAVTVHPTKELSFSATGSWNDLTMDKTVESGGFVYFEKGNRLVNSPKYTAGLDATYEFPLGASGFRGRFSIAGNYTSNIYQNNALSNGVQTYEGESLLLGRTRFAIEAPKHWTITAFVENLNNYTGSTVVAVPFTSAAGPQWHLPENLLNRVRPRTYGLQFDWHLR